MLLLLPLSPSWGQEVGQCEVRIEVADTQWVLAPDGSVDSVSYLLQGPTDADSLLWQPAALFADPHAASQRLAVGCYDSVSVSLTAYYHNANLFHWQQPGFVRSHTSYNYIPSPSEGDLCQPRSITFDAFPQDYCPAIDYSTSQPWMVIRPDTLWSYGDSIQPFFPLDTLNPVTHLNTLLQSIRAVPTDGRHVPFYVDTVYLNHPAPNHNYVLYLNHFTASQLADSLYSVPMLIFTVNIDDTVPRFFDAEHTVPLCDTTLFYFLNYSLPTPLGAGSSRFINSTVLFNMHPAPTGRAIFRFYETLTPYFHTTDFYCFNRIEMADYCSPSDSLMLFGPRCNCTVRDTLSLSVCPSRLPYLWDGHLFTESDTDSTLIRAIQCDTLRLYCLTLRPADTLSRSDTIVENQLPWIAYGDTLHHGGTYTFTLPGHEPDCDTLLHYRLTVIPNQTDTVYYFICPGSLPYTVAGTVAHADTLFSRTYHGARGEDSTVTYILTVKSNTDTAIYDTIVQSQLPWPFLDSLFTDTVSAIPFLLTNEAGCDSIILYNLFIYWEGDHCDSLLQFPNVVTPNGDGQNDRFVIGGLVDNQCYPYNLLIIVDRTGRVVFRAENIFRDDQFWNPAAMRAPGGTYFYRFVGRGVNHTTHHQGCIEVLK